MKNYLDQAGFCPSKISGRGENLLFFVSSSTPGIFAFEMPLANSPQ
jgi:hypothetical protein